MLIKTIINVPCRRIIDINFVRKNIYTTPTVQLNQFWRMQKRLPRNPNTFGPLTNLPDYSFKDGRPAPYGVKQLIRINKQREYFTKIKQLTGEIDNAVTKHARLEEEKERKKREILESKLKPKGHLLTSK